MNVHPPVYLLVLMVHVHPSKLIRVSIGQKKSSVVRVTVPKSVGSVGRIFLFFLEIMGKIKFQNTVRNTYVTNKYTNMLGK